jgi:hypothetical protein
VTVLIAVGTLKSRGATTTALGLAAHWNTENGEERPVVVELDPEGGDVAAYWRVRIEHGLADVIALLASGPPDDADALAAGAVAMPVAGVAVPVVCAAPGGRGVRKALPMLTAPGAKLLDPPDGTVIADLGRLYADSPAWAVAATSDVLVCVTEGTLAAVAQANSRLEDLTGLERLGPRTGLVVVECDSTAAEVEEVVLAADLDVRVLGAAGPGSLIDADPPTGRAARRGHRAWEALAESVRDLAAAPRPLALTAGPAPEPEVARS